MLKTEAKNPRNWIILILTVVIIISIQMVRTVKMTESSYSEKMATLEDVHAKDSVVKVSMSHSLETAQASILQQRDSLSVLIAQHSHRIVEKVTTVTRDLNGAERRETREREVDSSSTSSQSTSASTSIDSTSSITRVHELESMVVSLQDKMVKQQATSETAMKSKVTQPIDEKRFELGADIGGQVSGTLHVSPVLAAHASYQMFGPLTLTAGLSKSGNIISYTDLGEYRLSTMIGIRMRL